MTENDQSSDDSRVRDHLANERTYLAWNRTGVATMGLGVVIAKLKYLLGPSYPESVGLIHAANIGLCFVLIGLATIGLSLYFFQQTQKEIREGAYRSRSTFVFISAGLMIFLGLVILWYLIQPTVL